MSVQRFFRVPNIKIKDAMIRQVTEEPLRILFCGSDSFSIASLRKLYNHHQTHKNLIASIDVVCRQGKRVGRGLKNIREVPVSEAAKQLRLPLHEIDTFDHWKPPEPEGLPINLVIAVSFGLFIPPKILGAAKYQGLNVHPSMLPDFYGPAPLHHTLLTGSEFTGVTIQTLHPKRFDRGIILSQTPYPGIRHNCSDVKQLSEKLGLEGANMLAACIENHLYLYGSQLPVPERDQDVSVCSRAKIARHARKITTADRFVDWTKLSGKDILSRHQIIGPLWSSTKPIEESENGKRIIWSAGFEVADPIDTILPVGQPVVIGSRTSSRATYVRTCDNQVLKINKMKIEGGDQDEPLKAAMRARMHDPNTVSSDGPLFRTQISSSLPAPYRERQNSVRVQP